ncbi:MAG: thiosulfate oxidation carrier protein SoxY [Alphaproteobacteria bacterium]|nr:MAG: thiosulfate oxidation carrier protein SoxY [Alphaproteobacteria bacterium]
MKRYSRRETLKLGLAAGLAVALAPRMAFAKADDAQALINKFTGGKTPSEGKVTLQMPEIAENGNTVPLTVSVESPMTKDNYVKRVLIVADGNPRPEVATFNFTPRSGVAEASTRMRMAKTQNIIAVAEMSDGSFHMTKRQVKVTIGGCGG